MTDSTFVKRFKPHQAPRIASRLGQLDLELTERCNIQHSPCCNREMSVIE
ncbi:MAG: hypothetical protein L0Y55_02835 [Anaerolineales bacterium]|nr:hypothetical protein [Anaerolineales bacterium]